MRRKISLYIADWLADLSDQSLVLFNYTMDNLENPAIVRNSYSQKVTLPSTKVNETIFNEFHRLERININNGFSSLAKTPFVIFDENGVVLESGYAKLEEVNYANGQMWSYSVSLYGGLGGFFYDLMYNLDGSKKTLADLIYKDVNGEEYDFTQVQQTLSAAEVESAWSHLANNTLDSLDGIINYAPCYNGFPSGDFAANRAIYRQGTGVNTMPNLYVSKTQDLRTYIPKNGNGGAILLEMQDKHTEWEMQDLRAYLQRPVISVKALLNAFTIADNTNGYTFVLDPLFFNADNDWYNKGWMTLPMFDRSKVNPLQSFQLATLLRGTDTPAEYLIGFAKMFGCVFITDPASKTITLTGRNNAYVNETIDLTGRISAAKSMRPQTMESKFYSFGNDVNGDFATEYAKKYGKPYGAQIVNTGFDFNADTINTLDGIVLKGGADVLESSPFFQVFGGTADPQTGGAMNYCFKSAFLESVKWKLYNTGTDGKQTGIDCEPNPYAINGIKYSLGTTYNDFLPKVQLHSAENKADDGSNVLLFFNGMKQLPVYTSGGFAIYEVRMHLSNDTQEMFDLAGKPCWEVSVTGNNIIDLSAIPSFRRWEMNGNTMVASWDFGDPAEIAVDDTLVLGKGLYPAFWQTYIHDKFSADNKVVTLKVDFSGIQVGEGLLRRFYYFENCIWVLNKIINHSLTTWDLTECEFIKVADIESYTNGQLI